MKATVQSAVIDGSDTTRPRRNDSPPGSVKEAGTGQGSYRCDIHLDDAFEATMAEDVLRGLTQRSRSLLSKYLYDERGAALFDQLTRLPQYYPARAEHSILRSVVPSLVREISPDDLVEIGSGSSGKIRHVLDALSGGVRSIRYVPVDIDERVVEPAAQALLTDYPGLHVHAVVTDFELHFDRIPPPRGRRLVLLFGNAFGNLTTAGRYHFLRRMRRSLRGGDRLLLGLHLVNEPSMLEAAYNDGQGLAAAFNRNILEVANRCLGGNFEPRAFRHRAFYRPELRRIEMRLIPEARQAVCLRALPLNFTLGSDESISTGTSYRFTRESAAEALHKAGLTIDRWLPDADHRVALAIVRRESASRGARDIEALPSASQ